MTTRVGFTGSQQGMTGSQSASILKLLQLFKGDEFHHGGCVGADVQAAELARLAGYRTIRHPGDILSKQGVFDDDEVREPLANLHRNKVIVAEVEVMLATPGQSQEITRSGTWATIREARRTGRTIYVVLPNGLVT